MTISFHLPSDVQQAIARCGGDPALELQEAGLVELYRLGKLSHGQLAEGLDISRTELDSVLKRHKVTEDLPTAEEIGTQISHLRKLVG